MKQNWSKFFPGYIRLLFDLWAVFNKVIGGGAGWLTRQACI